MGRIIFLFFSEFGYSSALTLSKYFDMLIIDFFKV